MEQGIKEVRANVPCAIDLDPYHQLVELQKQMINLAQQNERIRQECETLREQVVAARITRPGMRLNLRPAANPKLKPFSRAAAVRTNLLARIIKEPSKC
jgi:hypothetical protein